MSAHELDLPDPSETARRGGLGPVGVILVCACALAVLGLMAVFSATAFRSSTFFWKQILGLGLAAGAGFFVSRLDLEYCRRHVWLIAGAAIFLLLIVAVPGIGISVNGSRRWLGLGPI